MSDPHRDPGSRYDGLEILAHVDADGVPRPYLARRIIPPPDESAVLGEHTVEAGDRLDQLAAAFLGDPEQSWRIADANAVLAPAELTARIGQRIKVALPGGIPGAPDVR